MSCIVKEELCTGCFACVSACPFDAIKKVQNSEGFYYPDKDLDKCKNCGKCEKSCPVLNPISTKNKILSAFAGMADDDVRLESSSGGIFYPLAQKILSLGGYVCAAVWDYENQNVKHIVSNKEEDIFFMQKSKYVQSDLCNVFNEIKNILKDEKYVLFVGTPCQVAGLKNFLSKDYEKLFTVDLICFGVPSEKVLKKFLSEENIRNLKEINMRSMKSGWNPDFNFEINNSKIVISSHNYFFKAFTSNLSKRKSCATCQFTNKNRMGDLTLADYWWIKNRNKNLDDSLGTSLILVNNKKGKILLNSIKKNLKILKRTPENKKWITNTGLYRPAGKNKNREQFFANIDSKTLKQNVLDCLNDKVDVCIINMWWAVSNYGALLTGYALQQLLKQLGYTSMLINNISMCPDQLKIYHGTFNQKFKDKYLNTTDICWNDLDFQMLNNKADIFITGSDQVFAPKWMQSQLKYYMLDFADISKKKIAFSASFGIDEDEFRLYDNSIIEKMNKSLQTFDYISTREISGKQVAKNIFNKDVDFTLDPVFLIDKSKYETLAFQSERDFSNKIVSYVLDDNEEYDKVYDYLSKKYNFNVIKIYNSNIDVEEWLASIKNCSYFITDSFHGFCFALIFNKPFILVKNRYRGAERFNSIFSELEIEDSSVSKINEVLEKNISFTELDYAKVNKKIEELKIDAINKLKIVLETKKNVDFHSVIANLELNKFNAAYYANIRRLSLQRRAINKLKRIYHRIFG